MRIAPSLLALLLAACSGGSGGPGGGTCTTRPPLACWTYVDQGMVLLATRAPIRLTAACSYSYEGQALSYAWSLAARPAGSAASLSGAASTVDFVADVEGEYAVALAVTDGCGTTATQHAVHPVEWTPWADAGEDRYVAFTDPAPAIALDGSGSSDENLDPLAYAWTITARPPGSTAPALAGAGTAHPVLTPDVPGTYELTLVVSDGRSTDLDVVQVGAYHPARTIPIAAWDVEYSAPLDRLVALEYLGTSLWIVDPADGTRVEVPLAATAYALGVSLDGRYAAASHAGKISYVDLAAGELVRELATSLDGGDVVLPGDGFAYVFPRADITKGLEVVPLDGSPATAHYTAQAESSPGNKPRANAAGTRMYALDGTGIDAWTIGAGTVGGVWTPWDGREKGPGPWLSPDGARLYTGGGDVYATSDFARLPGTLKLESDWQGVRWIDDSAEAGLIVSVEDMGQGTIRLHDRETLELVAEHEAPAKVEGEVVFGGPRQAFWKADGSGFRVVLQMWDGTTGIAEY